MLSELSVSSVCDAEILRNIVCGLSKSSNHYIVTSLVHEGYVLRLSLGAVSLEGLSA